MVTHQHLKNCSTIPKYVCFDEKSPSKDEIHNIKVKYAYWIVLNNMFVGYVEPPLFIKLNYLFYSSSTNISIGFPAHPCLDLHVKHVR